MWTNSKFFQPSPKRLLKGYCNLINMEGELNSAQQKWKKLKRKISVDFKLRLDSKEHWVETAAYKVLVAEFLTLFWWSSWRWNLEAATAETNGVQSAVYIQSGGGVSDIVLVVPLAVESVSSSSWGSWSANCGIYSYAIWRLISWH